jgi:hypothetical protein
MSQHLSELGQLAQQLWMGRRGQTLQGLQKQALKQLGRACIEALRDRAFVIS